MVITIILFLIIFTIMVVAHELGHFLLAKANGIRVKEFFVGMGPTLFHVKKGETVYSLKLLPLGGACVFDGEDGMDLKEGEAPKEGSFPAANVWARIATVIAGPIFNFILAYVFSLIIVAACGVTLPTIGSVTDGGAAQEAGLQAGDVITRLDGKRIHLFLTPKQNPADFAFITFILSNSCKFIYDNIWKSCLQLLSVSYPNCQQVSHPLLFSVARSFLSYHGSLFLQYLSLSLSDRTVLPFQQALYIFSLL